MTPAKAVLYVVEHNADPLDRNVQQVQRLLAGTVDGTLGGLADRERREVRTLLDRTIWTFLALIVAVGGRVDVVGLIAWRILTAVLDADVLVLPEGTPLSDALKEMRPALERATHGSGELARVEVEWPAALARLQALALYARGGGAKGVALRVLNLGLATATPTGKLMLTVMGGVGEVERSMMLVRQREGIAKAKGEGRYEGRRSTARAKAS